MSKWTRETKPLKGKGVRETGSRGNKHYTARRPEGPPCTEPGCTELWKPVCPNRACAGHTVPMASMKESNERGFDARDYGMNGGRR